MSAIAVGTLLSVALQTGAPAARCRSPAGSWVAMNAQGAPIVSTETPVVWAGSRLLVFGASGGAIFDPCANRWRRMSKAGLPTRPWEVGRLSPVVAGRHVVFLARGNLGEVPYAVDGVTAIVYDVAADRWSTVPDQPDALPWRRGALVAAVGREVIVWGGVVEENLGRGGRARLLADGARLDPALGTWRAVSGSNAPSGRSYPGAVWTGTRLVVWGGIGVQLNPYQCGRRGDCEPTAGGAVYDPAADVWTPMSDVGAPSARQRPALKRVGRFVLVWGGFKHPDGALYDAAADRWQTIPPPPAPIARAPLDDFNVAVDAGRIVVITNARQAAIYDVAGSSWTTVPDAELPVGLKDLRSLGDSGLQLIVGRKQVGQLGVGWLARVNAGTARWEVAPLALPGAPTSLETGIVAWSDERLVVWGHRHQEVRYQSIPGQAKGCGPHVPGQPICDPVVPVREVRLGRAGVEGGLIRPVFAPARSR